MKGSFVLLSSLLSISARYLPPHMKPKENPWSNHPNQPPPNWTPPGLSSHGGHKQIPFNRGVAGSTWCDDFQKGIDGTVGCDDTNDKIFGELDGAISYCDEKPDCIGVTKHPNGKFTPRCGIVLTEGISDTVSWRNKDGCFSVNTWCEDFQQGIDGTVGCDNGVDKVFSELNGAKLYCNRTKKCIGVTKHPNGKFTPRCGEVLTDEIPDVVFWLNKDGCFPLA